MSDDIYCGIGKPPKGKKIGSMKECAEMGQVRYYGIKKVDKKLIDNILNEKKRKSSSAGKLDAKKQTLFESFVVLKAKIKKLEALIGATKDKKEKVKLEKELGVLDKKKEALAQEITAIDKAKKGKSRSSKRTTSNKKVKKSKTKSKSKSKSKGKSKSKSGSLKRTKAKKVKKVNKK